MTHTYVILDVSQPVYDEIAQKLQDAQYDHAFINDNGQSVIDMHGIALRGKSTLSTPVTPLIWKPIISNPRDNTWFIGRFANGSVMRMRWASKLIGPTPFAGYVYARGDSLIEVPFPPTHWIPMPMVET